MLYALWNDTVINAEAIAQTEASETPVRKASGNKMLRCIDPDCEKPLVGYRHGPLRSPHFYHIEKGGCDYGDFDSSDTSPLREARSALYNHFKSLGYEVEREKKLPDSRKYAHLVLHIGDKNIVIQIAQATTSANQISSFTLECEKCGYELRWIVLGYYFDIQWEKDNYHAMRYQFNHSENRDLLVLDMDAEKISQTQIGESQYIYKNYNLQHRLSFDIHNFRLVKAMDSLRIVDGELSLDGFSEAYKSWLKEKQSAFDIMKHEIDEQERRRELEASLKKRVSKPPVFQTTSAFSEPALSSPHRPSNIVTPEMISQFKEGTNIKHRIFGNGRIISITLNPETNTHTVFIKFEKGKQCNKVLENLLVNDTIHII